MANRYRAKQTLKIGGKHRIPSQDSGEFEWNPKWGDPDKFVSAGVIERVGAREAEDTSEPAPAFASPAAANAAEEAGLTLADFEGRDPSGKSGFTVADVDSLVEELAAPDEDDGA